MQLISDIGRFGSAATPGRLLDDLDQQSPAELQRVGFDQTNRLITTGAGASGDFEVLRGGTRDFLQLGSGQVYAGVARSSSGNEILDEITGTVGKLQSQLDRQLDAA